MSSLTSIAGLREVLLGGAQMRTKIRGVARALVGQVGNPRAELLHLPHLLLFVPACLSLHPFDLFRLVRDLFAGRGGALTRIVRLRLPFLRSRTCLVERRLQLLDASFALPELLDSDS